MLFLSFAEIFIESKEHFLNATSNEHIAYPILLFLNPSMLYACLSLFSGIFTAFLLEGILHKSSSVEFELPQGDEKTIRRTVHAGNRNIGGNAILRSRVANTKSLLKKEYKHSADDDSILPHAHSPAKKATYPDDRVKNESLINENDEDKSPVSIDTDMNSRMKTVGVLSAVAITLHNIPEGIVTFIGYVDNPVVGISLAIGIATHNIPEGLSVALPVYYATNSRNRAFLWSLCSGLAEPFGAFLCMLVLQQFVSENVFGFLFGFTGGIMTHICIFELIPTGILLSPEKNYTTVAFLCGMGFIMISLILL